MFRKSAILAFTFVSLTLSSVSNAGIRQFSEDFERPFRGWFFTGGAGFDYNKGLAHGGKGNAWVRNTKGWNAVNFWADVPTQSQCYVNAWLRLSPELTDGYISVRNDKDSRPVHNFDVINELKLVGPGPVNPAHSGYN